MYDFHSHTFLSDGVLSPVELIRRAHVRGYRVIGVTDHVGMGNVELVVKMLVKECAMASARWDILALPGVEITHVPKEDIDLVAEAAKGLGAVVVVVHGETIVEPVEPGTNRAAISSPSVDILAHPGIIAVEDARPGVGQGGVPGGVGPQRPQPRQRARGADGSGDGGPDAAGLGCPRARRSSYSRANSADRPRRWVDPPSSPGPPRKEPQAPAGQARSPPGTRRSVMP